MRTTRELLTRSRLLFNSEFVDERIQRANRHKWVRAVQSLGPRWVYWERTKLQRRAQ